MIYDFFCIPNPIPYDETDTEANVYGRNDSLSGTNFYMSIYITDGPIFHSEEQWLEPGQTMSFRQLLQNIQTPAYVNFLMWQQTGEEWTVIDQKTLEVTHGEEPIICENLISQAECEAYECFWYDNSCHSEQQSNNMLLISGAVFGIALITGYIILKKKKR